MKSEHKVCVECSDPFFGTREKCRRCQKRETNNKMRLDPFASMRIAAQKKRYRQTPEAKAKQRGYEKTYAAKHRGLKVSPVIEVQRHETPAEEAERKRKARDVIYSTNYRKKNEAAFKSGPDERPPGTQFNGTWRCPGCGGKMLGRVKRCLPCSLTKQDDSNEQNESGKYQTV
jgi:hypothetical protein